MKSFRDDLNDRMKTGWGRFVLASEMTLVKSLHCKCNWKPVKACGKVYLVIEILGGIPIVNLYEVQARHVARPLEQLLVLLLLLLVLLHHGMIESE
jgi:hypothetical protein